MNKSYKNQCYPKLPIILRCPHDQQECQLNKLISIYLDCRCLRVMNVHYYITSQQAEVIYVKEN